MLTAKLAPSPSSAASMLSSGLALSGASCTAGIVGCAVELSAADTAAAAEIAAEFSSALSVGCAAPARARRAARPLLLSLGESKMIMGTVSSLAGFSVSSVTCSGVASAR